jgi:hypothetical protein
MKFLLSALITHHLRRTVPSRPLGGDRNRIDPPGVTE